jgi:hypothetical protein
MINFTVQPIYFRGKRPRHPLNGRLNVSLRWSGHFTEQLNLLPLSGIETRFLSWPARILVTILTELLWAR